jgi:hypothetical protein
LALLRFAQRNFYGASLILEKSVYYYRVPLWLKLKSFVVIRAEHLTKGRATTTVDFWQARQLYWWPLCRRTAAAAAAF